MNGEFPVVGGLGFVISTEEGDHSYAIHVFLLVLPAVSGAKHANRHGS